MQFIMQVIQCVLFFNFNYFFFSSFAVVAKKKKKKPTGITCAQVGRMWMVGVQVCDCVCVRAFAVAVEQTHKVWALKVKCQRPVSKRKKRAPVECCLRLLCQTRGCWFGEHTKDQRLIFLLHLLLKLTWARLWIENVEQLNMSENNNKTTFWMKFAVLILWTHINADFRAHLWAPVGDERCDANWITS